MNQLIKIAPLMLLISGCVVGPDWQTPETALPAQFVGQQNASLHEVSEREWWREMNDPQLTALIERGLLQSLDLGAALEQVYQADAALRATGVNSALDGSLAAEHTYTKTEGQSGSWASNGSLSAGLVLDFFGGVRREREAAVANLIASEANVEVERLAWLAELVSNYTNARYYQQAMRLTESTIDTRQETLDITEQEYNAGSSTSYNVAIVQAALQSSQAELPAYQALYEASVFAIATLINEPAGPLLAQLDGTQSALQLPTTIDGGLPADLLRNRPDLRYYQSVLHQQMAGVGVSEAALYPSFSLDGVVSVTDSVTAWSFGPSLT